MRPVFDHISVSRIFDAADRRGRSTARTTSRQTGNARFWHGFLPQLGAMSIPGRIW
jgi:hypothetical protein